MFQQEIRVSGKTGTICQVTGPYCSEKDKSWIMMVSKGEKFTVGFDGLPTTWWMVKE